jgi:hypothetical protein
MIRWAAMVLLLALAACATTNAGGEPVFDDGIYG